jgi:hypothetical protein
MKFEFISISPDGGMHLAIYACWGDQMARRLDIATRAKAMLMWRHVGNPFHRYPGFLIGLNGGLFRAVSGDACGVNHVISYPGSGGI